MQPFVVDCSHHNTLTDPKQFRVAGFAAARAAGIVGIIHKATQGLGYKDPKYDERRKMALDAGLAWGAYHFNTGDPVPEQVNFFLHAAQPDGNTLVALDFEDNRASNMSIADAVKFLRGIETALARKAVVYGGNRIKENLKYLSGPDRAYLMQHRLWLCEYGPKAVLADPDWPWWLWQFTGDGFGPLPHTIPGFVDHGLDINTYAKDSASLLAEWAS